MTNKEKELQKIIEELERELNEANQKNKHLSKEVECLKAQLSTGDILYDKANARLKQLQDVAMRYFEMGYHNVDEQNRIDMSYEGLPDEVKGKVE